MPILPFCLESYARITAGGILTGKQPVDPITTTTEFFEVSAKVSGHTTDRPRLPDHTPKILVQSPQRVARAVVRCLRRPCPEVWTSRLVRTVAGFMTISPRFYDWTMRRHRIANHD